MRRFLSELPQSTAGTIGAEEIVRGWWNEMGGKSGSVRPENITAMTIKRREIDELIERLSVLASPSRNEDAGTTEQCQDAR